MKDYVKRYIYAVTRRLPEDARDEVEAELQAHISDMLSENPSDEEIDQVLHELGHPRDIASNYDDRKRYVIAPEFYADYQIALKIGLVAVGIFALFFSALDALLSIDQNTVWQAIWFVIEHVLNATFNAVVIGFAVVTIGFWVASSDKVRKMAKPWKLKDLMEVPKDYKTTSYKQSKAIVGLVFQVIATTAMIVILLYYLERFGIYQNDILVAPLFGMDVISPYIMFLIAGPVIVLISQVLLIIQKRYTISMLLIYTFGQVLSAIFTIIMIQSNGFITDLFITRAAQNAGMSVLELANAIHILIIVLTVLIVLGNIGDLFTQWKKLFRPLKNKA